MSRLIFNLAFVAVVETTSCPYMSGVGTEEQDDQALLATKVLVHRAGEQRSDDLSPVPPPAAISPPVLLRSSDLPIPEPKPVPNNTNNPLINGYIPQNCMDETWPFFVDAPGLWAGDQGQNFIALPQANAKPAGKDFLVQVNRYNETLHLEATGPVLNRGYMNGIQVPVPPLKQSDQVFSGVRYTQHVTDMDLKAEIHMENGFVLHQSCAPVNAAIADNWQVTRFGAIPHGSQPMGFGNMTIVEPPTSNYYVQNLLQVRASHVFSVQPFVPGCGPQFDQQATPGNNSGPFAEAQGPSCCIGGKGYMKGTDQCPQTGCPEPIDELIAAVKDLNVVKYVQFNLSTADVISPFIKDGMWEPGILGGGVQNTAFVNINVMAEPESFRFNFWYLTVQNEDGSTYDLIQYIQTVNLKFLRKRNGCPDQLWPHVDANTLHRVGPAPAPPAPSPSTTPEPTPAPTPQPTPAPTPQAPTPCPPTQPCAWWCTKKSQCSLKACKGCKACAQK